MNKIKLNIKPNGYRVPYFKKRQRSRRRM